MTENTYSVRGKRPRKKGGMWYVTLTVTTLQGDRHVVASGETHEDAWVLAHEAAVKGGLMITPEMLKRIEKRVDRRKARLTGEQTTKVR